MKRWEVEKLQKTVDKLRMQMEIIAHMRLLMDDPSMPPAGVESIADSICEKVEEMADILAELDGELTILGKSSRAGEARQRRESAVSDKVFSDEKVGGMDDDDNGISIKS